MQFKFACVFARSAAANYAPAIVQPLHAAAIQQRATSAKITFDTLLLFASTTVASCFPSAAYGLVIPGGHEAANPSSSVSDHFQTADSVKEWEIQHSATSFGGDFGPVDNSRLGVMLGYMYAQVLNFDPHDTEMAFRRRALDSGVDYEDFFLHFSEDTEIDPPNPEHASTTSLFGLPWVVGYTATAGHAGFWLYQSPPWDATAAWSGAATGGALYVYQFERFDEITLSLASAGRDGSMLIEYPSAVGTSSASAHGITVDRLATAWSALPLISDGTSALSRNGTIRWQPPADWVMASTHDGSGSTYGGTGPYFGQTRLRDGGVAYVLRISWVVDEANAQTAVAPTLTDVRLRRWVAPVADSTTSRALLPGWDPANDADGDGYVSDAEASSRANPRCTARFRYESRALPWGRMWSAASSWCRVEPSNEQLTVWLAEWLNETWGAQGMGGAYNDDLLKLMGPAEYNVVSGGALEGYAHRANASALVVPYQEAFAAMLERIRALTRKWIAANISARNMFMEAATRVYLRTLSFLLREDYVTSATGLTGYFGHLKAWDVAAAARLGIRSLLQCQLRHGRVLVHGVANRSDWEYEQESCVAQYYLLHFAGLTYLNIWGNRYWYGSANTWNTGAAGNWWEAGVPMNVAYQPTSLLQADIGEPQPDDTAAILADEEPIQYMVRTQVPLSDYTLVGWSNESLLRHAELNESGALETLRSNVYYAQREPDSVHIPGAPQSAVLARRYTKGLVLFRTSLFGGQEDFMDSLSEEFPLKGWYRRVSRVAGSSKLSEPSSAIRLHGYEGAILLRVPPPSPTSPPSPPPAPSAPPAKPPPPVTAPPNSTSQQQMYMSHEVAVEFVAAGSPEDYGESARQQLVDAFAALAGVPASRISLSIEAGSVIIRVIIAVASVDGATVLSASLASILVNASSASAILGVDVQSSPTIVSREVASRPSSSDAPPIALIATAVATALLVLVVVSLRLFCWARRRKSRTTPRVIASGPAAAPATPTDDGAQEQMWAHVATKQTL